MSSSDLSEWASEDDAPALIRPTFKSKTDEVEWERKQRNREYRVAARREKRTRKADEKKQRKLNATILRRMTKNPDKYNKNVDRNRRREIEMERRKIYKEAIQQAERLAAIHDPSGKLFNVGPVVVQEDGKVVSVEFLQRRAHAQAERDAKVAGDKNSTATQPSNMEQCTVVTAGQITNFSQDYFDPTSRGPIQVLDGKEVGQKRLSKNQQKKLALLGERPPPKKPVIPDEFKVPEGEENWLALWDVLDDELERRVVREKKRKAMERKALRQKQKEGKAERRAARDERRRVYREKKLEWKAIKEEEKLQKKRLLRVEQEEAKRIEIEVNKAERQRAMEVCAKLGFTLDNVEGVADIKPKALGMKGQEVDFDILEIGNRPSELRINHEKIVREPENGKTKRNRIDLGKVVDESKTRILTSDSKISVGLEGDFVSLDFGGGGIMDQQSEALNYNHKLRRKLHRAIEAAQIQKELLVRSKAKEFCETKGIEVPAELAAEYKPVSLAGRRILEDGTIETEKQERVRKRLELAEYNKAAKVLRQQAKAEAIEAGLRVFAELTGKHPIGVNETALPLAEEETIPNTIDDDMKEHDIVCVTDGSKKRRRGDKDAEVNTTKKSMNSSTSVLARGAEARQLQDLNKKTNEQDGSGLATSSISSGSACESSHLERSKSRDKKRKIADDQNGQIYQSNLEEDDEAKRKVKKRKLEKRQKLQQTMEETLPDTTALQKTIENSSSKSKKSKLRKVALVGTPSTNGIGSEMHPTEPCDEFEDASNVRNGYQWNLDALNGNAARKDKFLRLLGVSKNDNGTTKKPPRELKVKNGLSGLEKMESELERQFETGMRIKHEGQRKKGLGA